MKALILSFFAVLLTYSFFFDKNEKEAVPVLEDSNSVYLEKPENVQLADSVIIFCDLKAFIPVVFQSSAELDKTSKFSVIGNIF